MGAPPREVLGRDRKPLVPARLGPAIERVPRCRVEGIGIGRGGVAASGGTLASAERRAPLVVDEFSRAPQHQQLDLRLPIGGEHGHPIIAGRIDIHRRGRCIDSVVDLSVRSGNRRVERVRRAGARARRIGSRRWCARRGGACCHRRRGSRRGRPRCGRGRPRGWACSRARRPRWPSRSRTAPPSTYETCAGGSDETSWAAAAVANVSRSVAPKRRATRQGIETSQPGLARSGSLDEAAFERLNRRTRVGRVAS